MQKTLNGNFSLLELQNTLITEEQLGFKLLTALEKRPGLPPANIAIFEDDPNPDSPGSLVLVEIPAGKFSEKVKEQVQQGRHLISCKPVFVAGGETMIGVFR